VFEKKGDTFLGRPGETRLQGKGHQRGSQHKKHCLRRKKSLEGSVFPDVGRRKGTFLGRLEDLPLGISREKGRERGRGSTGESQKKHKERTKRQESGLGRKAKRK